MLSKPLWIYRLTDQSVTNQVLRSLKGNSAKYRVKIPARQRVKMAEPSEAETRDQAFVDIAASISPDGPTFTERESLVLSLYDQLHELRLEHALLEAQQASETDLYST